MYIWLILLGIFTYLIVQRSAASITRTPVWLLWLVWMAPAFIWVSWFAMTGDGSAAQESPEPFPLLLLLTPFIICPFLYFFLVQWGRLPQPTSDASSNPETSPLAASALEKRSTVRPIDRQEEATLHTCFPWSIYYLQNIEYRPQAMICRGQLRTAPEVAYKTIRENIEAKFGDRFLVIFQEGLNGKPFFALVPNPRTQATDSQDDSATNRWGLALGLFLVTLLTTCWAGIVLASSTDASRSLTWSTIQTGIPYALALMGILGVHELAHYLTARSYKIRATLPYFIPVPVTSVFALGTFGAFIQMRSPIPNRKALFDVGIAGPLAGFLVALPVLFWGFAHSTPVELTDESGLFNFDSFRPTTSLLLALLSKMALGDSLSATNALNLHPVAIAGCLGIVVTALNLMPVGQLDGGHIVHAMFGQRTGALIGQVARLLILALSFAQQEFLLWAILLFFIPVMDEPTLNDVNELDNRRDLLGLLALTLLVIIILPAPQPIIQLVF